MINIKFKNMDKSEMAKEAVQERVAALTDKFPDLKKNKMSITLEMENSPIQAGPDLFKIKMLVIGGKYDGIIIEKKDSSLYVALAEVVDHALEALNRMGDKIRVKERAKARSTIQVIP